MNYMKAAIGIFIGLASIIGSLVAADAYDSAKIEKAKQELAGTFDGYRLQQAQQRMDDLTEQLEYDNLSEARKALKERELVYREREIDNILRDK